MAGRKRKQKPAAIGHRKVEIVEVEIDNPWHDGSKPESLGNPRRDRQYVNMRESIAAYWYYTSPPLIDQAEYMAATRFRKLWEQYCGTGARAIDYSAPVVDGGRLIDPQSDKRLDADTKLQEIRRVIGPDGYSLVRQLCGECQDARSIFATSWQRKSGTRRCRQMLTRMAEYWGYKTRPIRARQAS